MKTKIFLTIFFVAAVAVFIRSQTGENEFALAEDFPRAAVLYVQTADLPALLKIWDASELKDKYLDSANYNAFTNNHLGRKLASRRHEFDDAAGFPIDAEVLGNVSGNRAALAVYDVGKLEFVFIAPVSDEVFAATQFAVNRDNFAAETLSDGTTVYRADVKADRGRQSQKLIFAQLKGRFVLATSEKLLAETLNNINGRQKNNRLTDEPSFNLLSEKTAPHAATVWINQTVLNDDYYFRRYWLMSDVGDLKNIRAGIFDFEMQADKCVERRKFLFDKSGETALLRSSDAAQMTAFVPPNTPLYRLQTANDNSLEAAVEATIGAQPSVPPEKRNASPNYYAFGDANDYSSGDYESLSEKYDEVIDETDDAPAAENQPVEINAAKFLRTAQPRSILTFTQPKMLPAPLFVEFQRTAIFDLAALQSFDQASFEAAIGRKMTARMLIRVPEINLVWTTKNDGELSRRELVLPMLNRKISFARRGNRLILNAGDWSEEFDKQSGAAKIGENTAALNALTVIDLTERENAYDRVFAELNQQNSTDDDFFKNNIAGLLDVFSAVKKIEIRESAAGQFFDEEIVFSY